MNIKNCLWSLITGFIFNAISGISLYNNFNNRLTTVKASLQNNRNCNRRISEPMEQDNGTYYEEEDDE